MAVPYRVYAGKGAGGAEGAPAPVEADPRLEALTRKLAALAPFDKRAMSGPCDRETTRVELFMQKAFGFYNDGGRFVDGVRSFKLERPVAKLGDDEVVTFTDPRDRGTPPAQYHMTGAQIKRWQSTYRCFAPLEEYPPDDGLDLLRRSLAGGSDSGEEAFKMKFAIRASKNPIYCTFDGKLRSRNVSDAVMDRIYLLSVSGIDFAGRKHDVSDITTYIENASEVYRLGSDGRFITMGGRDFWPTGVRAVVRKERLWHDLYKMIHMRLRACDLLGVEVAVDTAIGLGVFAGEDIGVAPISRMFSAACLRKVLETEKFDNIKMVVCALPVFRRSDNYHVFVREFDAEGGYSGPIPVVMIDQDMHALAIASAEAGFITSELNPADSHGVFGEYWQNRGPAVEEKLALTTAGLLTQHHAVNPHVLDKENYVLLDLSASDGNYVVCGRAPLPAREADDGGAAAAGGDGGTSGGAGGGAEEAPPATADRKLELSCDVCGTFAEMRCPCTTARYCTKEHQRADWAAHKEAHEAALAMTDDARAFAAASATTKRVAKWEAAGEASAAATPPTAAVTDTASVPAPSAAEPPASPATAGAAGETAATS